MANQQLSPQQKQQQAQAQNASARQFLLAQSVDSWQQIAQGTLTSSVPGTVLNIPVRNVGLIKRFIIEIQAQFNGVGGSTQTLSAFGPANILSNVTFTDLSNQVRINSAGWHLVAVASAKNRGPYAASFTSDTPLGYGNIFTKTMAAPSTLTAAASGNNVSMMYEIPITYSDSDLRGGIYANVVNATMNLQLTINPNQFVASTADATTAVYQTSVAGTAGTLSNFTYTIYQNFLDQIPMTANGPVVPILDTSTAYLLNSTASGGIVASQDNPLPYANFRDFMSTVLVYDNAGTLNTGSDINYLSIQTANYTNLIKIDPNISSLWSRLRLSTDFPKGMYYFDHRQKPISTVQYGNMALIVNPLSVTSGASFLIGYESLALINMITQAGTLYGT